MSENYLHIIDNQFSHAETSSWYNKSNLFSWKRGDYHESDVVVVTNLLSVEKVRGKKVYGWIIEPPDIDDSQYFYAKSNYNKFEKIFTYDSELLSLSEKFEFLPMTGCWIGEEDRKIYEKTKVVCSITSHKRTTPLHRFRHEIINRFKNIDAYGNGYISIKNKVDVLKDYMFCLVVENQKIDFLFTEKLIDCFVTGTIPIYLGCPSINKFFNSDGILKFETLDELQSILNKLDQNFYLSKIESIKDNFERAKNYVIADDMIYKIIKNGWKFNL